MIATQLRAVRLCCLALIATIDLALGEQSEQKVLPNECQHPEEFMMDISAMGHPNRKKCGQCNVILEPQANNREV